MKSTLPTFYTELRHPGTAEDQITAFCDAMSCLLDRLVTDLRSQRFGRFGGQTAKVAAALADVIQASPGHVDALRTLALHPPVDPALAQPLQNAFANVMSDSGIPRLAEARALTPEARESKFDQGLTGKLVEEADSIGEKVESLVEGIAKLVAGEQSERIDGVGKIAGAILRDIGIWGRIAFGVSGGDEVGRQLEDKLEAALGGLDGLAGGQRTIIDRTATIDKTTRETDREVGKIEKKLDELGELLGQTLMSEPWIVDPDRTRTKDNATPARGVKEELHGIEDLLDDLYRRLVGRPFNPGGTVPRSPAVPLSPTVPRSPPVTDSPPGSPIGSPPGSPTDSPRPPPLLDPRIKKIFVYDEDLFFPASVADERVVRVTTEAFDLAGWFDLSELRPGDRVEIDLLVAIAGAPHRLYARSTFTAAGIVPFSAIARGENKVSGTDMKVVIRQPRSADDFATVVPLGYQLVVESQ